MTIGLVFWILMLIWFVFGTISSWPTVSGSNLILFILLVLLGWHSFGPPIHG